MDSIVIPLRRRQAGNQGTRHTKGFKAFRTSPCLHFSQLSKFSLRAYLQLKASPSGPGVNLAFVSGLEIPDSGAGGFLAPAPPEL
jgi:hypothetical protein